VRFIAVILSPGHLWTDYAVIDTERCVRMATCSESRDADLIAKTLNLRHEERSQPSALLRAAARSAYCKCGNLIGIYNEDESHSALCMDCLRSAGREV
jgi:hypothetical protein